MSLSSTNKRVPSPYKPAFRTHFNLFYLNHHQMNRTTLSNLTSLLQLCHITASTHHPQLTTPNSPINPTHLLRVCTILYQQQNAPDSKLRSHLQNFKFDLSHEFFLQVCNKFPYSWKPIYRFFTYTQTEQTFTHTPTTYNKVADVIGKARNIELFWKVLQDMGEKRLVNDKTFRIAFKTLASAGELKRCVEFFHLMNTHGFAYSLDILNKVVETLCGSRLVFEAKYIVLKLKHCIKPDGVTYKYLIIGFCEIGDVIEASKFWNLLVDEGFEFEIDAVETMMDTFFKNNQFDEAIKLFRSIDDLGSSTYGLVISWLCKRGKLLQVYILLEEMVKRGIHVDNSTLSALVYGLLSKGRIREAYKIVEGIQKPDICVYHGLIKGFIKLKKPSEATQVFREMVKRGCEPIMHTYIMLLQAHLGKRGRKGPHPDVNFETIFVGGLVKLGKSLKATKYVERTLNSGLEVPRFDYNKFLHSFSNEEGAVMFEDVGKRLREVGLVDLADILQIYGEKMTTRDRRRRMRVNNGDCSNQIST